MAQIEYRKKKLLSPKWILGGLMIAILMIASSILFLLYPFASKERSTYFTEKNPILFEGTQKGNALLEGDSIFLPLT
ncbi:peptidoglycan hydrolase, partial [Neobacillus drentensis]